MGARQEGAGGHPFWRDPSSARPVTQVGVLGGPLVSQVFAKGKIVKVLMSFICVAPARVPVAGCIDCAWAALQGLHNDSRGNHAVRGPQSQA